MHWNVRLIGSCVSTFLLSLILLAPLLPAFGGSQVGREVAIPFHIQDGQEFRMPVQELIAFGNKLFTAMFTIQEGVCRPLSKGTGNPLSDTNDPLAFPRGFNRISGPDSN